MKLYRRIISRLINNWHKMQYIEAFGLIKGLKLYKKINAPFPPKSFNIPKIKFNIYFNPKNIDICSFQEIFIEKQYEIKYPKHFLKEEINIIDGGANIGLSCIYFANKFKKSRIFAFEPESNNFKHLSKNCEKYSSIKLYKNAIWNKDSTVKVIDKGLSTRAFMIEETINENSASLVGKSIDSIVQENQINIIHILKLDIEGSEKELFESNYEKWITITKFIIIELHEKMRPGSEKSVFNTIKKYNFKETRSGENVVFENKDLLI